MKDEENKKEENDKALKILEEKRKGRGERKRKSKTR